MSGAFRRALGSAPVRLSPMTEDRITREYADTVETLFKAGFGDFDDSKNKALELVSRNYGEQSFGGKVITMKYPMDTYYPSPTGEDYITGQAVAVASMKLGEDVPADKIFFSWDDTTARQASTGKPSYPILVLDSENNPIPLGRFTPKPSLAKAEKVKETTEGFKKDRKIAKMKGEAGLTINAGPAGTVIYGQEDVN